MVWYKTGPNHYLNHMKPGPRLNIKTVFSSYGDSYVKDKMVGETVLSLTWESQYWHDGIFILRQPPECFEMPCNLKHKGSRALKYGLFIVP